jgi:RNA polymerase sigma-70 factor (ECF subfamily)
MANDLLSWDDAVTARAPVEAPTSELEKNINTSSVKPGDTTFKDLPVESQQNLMLHYLALGNAAADEGLKAKYTSGMLTWDDAVKARPGYVEPKSLAKRIVDDVNDLGKGTIQVTDMILGIPAWLAQLGMTGLASMGYAVAGDHTPLAKGAKLIGEATEKTGLLTPIQTYLLDTQIKDSTVSKILAKPGAVIDSAAEYWSEKTGNTETGEALKQSVNVGMAIFPKGAGAVWREGKAVFKGKATPKMPEVEPEGPPAEPEGPPAEPSPTVDYQAAINANTGVSTLTPAEAIAASQARIAQTREGFKKGETVTRASLLPPESGEAVWRSGDADYPVTVTGASINGPDGVRYTPVQYNGNASFIPTSELRAKVEPQVGLPEPKVPFEGVPKTRMVEGKTLEEAAAPMAPLDSALDKIRQGRSFDIDAVEKIALQSVLKAGGRIVDENGKPIGTGFQNGQVDPRLLAALGIGSAAVLMAIDPESRERLGAVGLVGATLMTGEGRSLAAHLKEGKPFTDPLFKALSETRTEFPAQTIRDNFGKTSAEAQSIFIRILGNKESITAKELTEGWVAETAGWKLTPEVVEPGRTRYVLPKTLQVDDAALFGPERVFGQTENFKAEDVKHVVNMGSVLAEAETSDSPILKNWPQKLVREELSSAAAQGEASVRFLSADPVVAKTAEYIKGLGGVELKDTGGRTWWDVPVDSVVKQTKAGPAIHMLGQADPELLAKIAGGVALGAYVMNSDNAKGLMLAGIGGTLAAKGGLKAMLEADLLKTAREGGAKAQAAFTELYTRNEPQLRKSVASFARSGVDIDDVVQRSFISAFQNLDNFRGESKFSTYLHRIAQNKAKNMLEYESGRPTSEITPEMEQTLGTNETPASIAQNKLLGSRLDEAMNKIDPNFRDSFLMREVEGMSYEDIAERRGIPVNTVRTQIFRAKEQLQRHLQDYADGDTGQENFGSSSATGRLGSKEGGATTPEEIFKRAGIFTAVAAGAYLDQDHMIEGGLLGLGAAVTALSLKSLGIAGIKDYVKQMQSQKPFLDIGPQILNTGYQIWKAERLAKSLTKQTEALHPEVEAREHIYKVLSNEATRASTPTEQKTVSVYREAFNTLGKYAKDAGVIKSLIQNYVTRIYGPQAVNWALDRVRGNINMDSPFGKQRMFPTLAKAEAAGFHPITTDITKVFEEYSRSVTSAVENQKLIDGLKKNPTGVEGEFGIMKEGEAPRDYMFVDHPSLRGFRVHPDYAPDLKQLMETFKPGAILNALDVINTTQKRGAVVLSMFHPVAIGHAFIGGMPLRKGIPGAVTNIVRALKPQGVAMLAGAIVGNQLNPDNPLLGLMGGAAVGGWAGKYLPARAFGENQGLRQLYNGTPGDFIDTAAKYGFRPGFENASPTLADMQGNYYQAMEHISKSLDKVSEGLGTNTVGKYTELNHQGDNFLFGRLMPMTKITVLMDKVRELQRNNAREYEAGRAPLKSEKEIYTNAISYTDDLIGGQNYTRLTQELTSRLGRSVAASALGPAGQFVGRMGLFAMDWTISTSRMYLKAFSNEGKVAAGGALAATQMFPDDKTLAGGLGALLGFGLAKTLGIKGGEGSGFRGLVRPTELADLHRQYLGRSLLVYTAAIDWLNYQNTGHHFWENKDITRLENADGTTTQVSKHFWEPVHWVTNFRQQLMNKSSFLVKEAGAQLLNADYLSTHKTPTMGDTPLKPGMSTEEMLEATKGNPTLQDRAAHAARGFSPITLQQNWEGTGASGLGGFLGSPTFGKSAEQKVTQKLLTKQLHASPEYKELQKTRKALGTK